MNPSADDLGFDGPWRGPHPLVLRTGKLLLVTGPGWTAEASWEKRAGAWICVAATHPIDWMLRMGSEAVVVELAKRGLKWGWI